MSQVVLIRHGESEWNEKNLFCGWHDSALSEKGKRDAHVSAQALKKAHLRHFDVAFTSCLTRASSYLESILKDLQLDTQVPVQKCWRLNERHYGQLTGSNKRQMADVYGEDQVQIWRRSYNVPPPQMTENNPYFDGIKFNPRFRGAKIPEAESLEMTMVRVVECWHNSIVPAIRAGQKVLIVAHGTSLRGLVKYLEDISDTEIMTFNIPNAIPFVINLDDGQRSVGGIQFLADSDTVEKAMEKVAQIGSKEQKAEQPPY